MPTWYPEDKTLYMVLYWNGVGNELKGPYNYDTAVQKARVVENPGHWTHAAVVTLDVVCMVQAYPDPSDALVSS